MGIEIKLKEPQPFFGAPTGETPMVEIVPEAEFTTRGCSVSRLLDSLARIPVLLSDEEAPLVSKWGKHPTKRYGQ